jgi:iron complex outermembrane recepter protein
MKNRCYRLNRYWLFASIMASSALTAPAFAQLQQPVSAQAAVDDGSSTEITVLGARRPDYSTSDSSTGLKIDAPLIETPLSVSVIPDTLIGDRAITNLDKLGDTVAGVQRQAGYNVNGGSSFILRGFRSDGAGSTTNGYRDFGFLTARDPISLDRVEFLKGPGSVLYGSSFAVGGLVNFVSKTPVNESFVDVGALGQLNYGVWRATVDANIADREERGGLRITAATGANDYINAFTNSRYVFVNANAAWRLTDTVKVLVEGTYGFNRNPGSDANGLDNATFLGVPIFLSREFSAFKPGAAWSKNTSTTLGFRAETEWAFADDGQLKIGFQRVNVNDNRRDGVRPDFDFNREDRLFSDSDGNIFFRRRASRAQQTQNDTAGLLEASHKIESGGVVHKILAGASYTNTSLYYSFFIAPLSPLNIANPVYEAAPPPDSSFSLEYDPEGYGIKAYGFYIQDFIEIGEKIRLLVAIRRDIAKSIYQLRDRSEVLNRQTDSQWSPRLGATFLPNPSLSIYASWSKSFSPNLLGRGFTGEQNLPERGTQLEAGIKTKLIKDMFLTLSAYQLKRRNIEVFDNDNPDFFALAGEQRSRGFEVELSGRVGRRLQLTASYSFVDGKLTEDLNESLLGLPLPLASKHSGNIFGRYDLPIGGDLTLGIGGGFFFASKRKLSLELDSVTLPAFQRVDMSFDLKSKGRWNAQVNIDDLFDEQQIESGGFFIEHTRGRTVTLSVGYQF